jgi:hypothetical protein
VAGDRIERVTGPVWAPSGDALAWVGISPAVGGDDLRVIVHEWDDGEVTEKPDRARAGQRPVTIGDGDSGDLRLGLETWQQRSGHDELVLTYQRDAEVGAATLRIGTAGGNGLEVDGPTAFDALAPGDEAPPEATWRPAVLGVAPSVATRPVQDDAFVLAGAHTTEEVDDLLLHRLIVDPEEPDRGAAVEGLPTPPTLTAFRGPPADAAAHWVAALGDAAMLGDGNGDAWIVLPGDEVVEVPGTVVDGAFLGDTHRD